MKKVSRKTMALSHENLSDEKMVGALALLDNRLFLLHGYNLGHLKELVYGFVRYGVCAS